MADIEEGVVVRKVRGPYKKRNLGEHLSAAERLKRMGWDPLGEMVQTHRKLLAEIERMELLRSGELVELTNTGKQRYYNEETHLGLYDKMIAISDKMMRYSYGRVSEAPAKDEIPVIPLIVQLSDGNSEFVIGGEDELVLEDDDDNGPSAGEYEFDPYVEASDEYHEEQNIKKQNKYSPPKSTGAPTFTNPTNPFANSEE